MTPVKKRRPRIHDIDSCRGRLRALYVHGRPRKGATSHGQWRTVGTWCLGCGEIQMDVDAATKV